MGDETCQALTKAGKLCRARAGEDGYCLFHSPATVEVRRAARQRGGYNRRPPHGATLAELPDKVRSIQDVLSVLDYTLRELSALDNTILRNKALVSLAGEYIHALETSDLETRIAALEAQYANTKR